MKNFPLKIDQAALGVWFLGWQHLVGSSLASLLSMHVLPVPALAVCLSPTGWCLMARSWQGLHQRLLFAPDGGSHC